MRNKKKFEPIKPTDDQMLEEKVDAMMDPKRPAPDASVADSDTPSDGPDADLPPLDIFAGTPGAPALPEEMQPGDGTASDQPGQPPAPEPDEAGQSVDAPDEDAAPAPLVLEDPASDAAVDDIVAHESHDPDGALPVDDERQAAAPRAHHHRIFWSLIAVLAIVAVIAGLLLAGGGNLNFPGGRQLQHWFTGLGDKFSR